MYMLDFIIIVLAFIAGCLICYLIFGEKLHAIERAVISVGLGVAIFVLAIFSSSGFSGLKEIRLNVWLIGVMAIIVSGVQIFFLKGWNRDD